MVGSSIQFSLNVRAESLVNRSSGLRVGLYQQVGTKVTGDATYANSKNDTGYYLAIGTGATPSVDIVRETANGGDSLMGGNGVSVMTAVGTKIPRSSVTRTTAT